MSERYIASVDQGTASSRCLIFDREGRVVSVSQVEHRQIVPRPGSRRARPGRDLEQRPVRRRAPRSRPPTCGRPTSSGSGITNQRETTVLWDRATGTPVHNALNWQDMRTDHLVHELGGDAGPDRFRDRCGLPLATYFSGPKIRWLLDHVDGLSERAEAGEVLFGTMDSWLIWKLTGRHITDVTNAGRTMLMNLDTLEWDDALLDAIGVPRAMLPEIRPSMEVYGEAGGSLAGLPVAAALGDQHAALFGQACFAPGDAKCTYGTGSFLLMNTGERARPLHQRAADDRRLQDRRPARDLRARGLDRGDGRAGPVVPRQARADRQRVGDRDARAHGRRQRRLLLRPGLLRPVRPALAHDARGVIAGLTGYISKGHLARAVLEATAWQTREVVDAMNGDAGVSVRSLKVDGGMTANNLLMQSLADVLDVPVVRPIVAETPSLGAAYAAGLAVGFWPDVDALRAHWHKAAEWLPAMEPAVREQGYRKWRKAVARHRRLGRRGRRLTSAEARRARSPAAAATTSRPDPGGRPSAGRGSWPGPCAPRAGSSPSCPPRPRRPSGGARRRATRPPPRPPSAPRRAGSSASIIVLSSELGLAAGLDALDAGLQRRGPAGEVELRLAGRRRAHLQEQRPVERARRRRRPSRSASSRPPSGSRRRRRPRWPRPSRPPPSSRDPCSCRGRRRRSRCRAPPARRGARRSRRRSREIQARTSVGGDAHRASPTAGPACRPARPRAASGRRRA